MKEISEEKKRVSFITVMFVSLIIYHNLGAKLSLPNRNEAKTKTTTT